MDTTKDAYMEDEIREKSRERKERLDRSIKARNHRKLIKAKRERRYNDGLKGNV